MNLAKYVVKRFLWAMIMFIIVICIYCTVFHDGLDRGVRGYINRLVEQKVSRMVMDRTIYSVGCDIETYKKQLKTEFEYQFYLDEPKYSRVFKRAINYITLNLGTATRLKTPHHPRYVYQRNSNVIKYIILENLPPTLYLMVFTTTLCIVLSLYLGGLKARFFNRPFDRVTSLLTMLFHGTPPWWVGTVLLMFLVFKYPIFDFGALNSVPPPDSAIGLFFDQLKYLLLPMLTVILVRFWGNAYLIKNLLLPPLQEDYIMAARGRGIKESKVVFGHAMRTAAPAILTLSVITFISAFTGDLALERILARPGIGTLMWDAANYGDTPLLVALLSVITLAYFVIFSILDLIYFSLDPRLKAG